MEHLVFFLEGSSEANMYEFGRFGNACEFSVPRVMRVEAGAVIRLAGQISI